jgi:hypothetical protein
MALSTSPIPKPSRKITTDGIATMLADPLVLSECDKDLPAGETGPLLRGLSVDSHGGVYGVATGCHCVAKVAPGGRVSTVLKAARPWSPTGVAVHGVEIYGDCSEESEILGSPGGAAVNSQGVSPWDVRMWK